MAIKRVTDERSGIPDRVGGNSLDMSSNILTVERLAALVDSKLITHGDVEELLHLSTEHPVEKINTIANPLPQGNEEKSIMETAKIEGFDREKSAILEALRKAEGNKSKAAKLLGIHRTTLYQKLNKFGLK